MLIPNRLEIHILPIVGKINLVSDHIIVQLFTSLTYWTKHLSKKNRKFIIVANFLDVKKTFDKMWDPGLIFELIVASIPTQLMNLFKPFISNRKFYVQWEKSFSSIRAIKAGVPQSSFFSPRLFISYSNDIPILPSIKLAQFALPRPLYF